MVEKSEKNLCPPRKRRGNTENYNGLAGKTFLGLFLTYWPL
jgi:hypothetical protein